MVEKLSDGGEHRGSWKDHERKNCSFCIGQESKEQRERDGERGRLREGKR